MEIKEFYKHFLKIRMVCTDSRKVVEGSIFFALKGENFNGNKFAVKALEDGCLLAVVDEKIDVEDKRIVKVPDVLTYLQELANYHRSQFDIPVLAITGTNGKTTSKELINAVLSRKYNVIATKGNLNNHIGVPLTLLNISDSTQIAVVEMGANHVGEIVALCEIANPNFGLITNIGNAHLEGFGSPEMVIKAKNELYRFISLKKGVVFINIDDEVLYGLAENLSKVTYGVSKLADVRGTASGDIFSSLKWCAFPDVENWYYADSKLVGGFNFYNIMAAISVGTHFGIEKDSINEALENYAPGLNRSQFVETEKNKVILDAYNANPDSMDAAINNFRQLNAERKVVILGDMFELGDYSARAHEDIVKAISESGFSEIYLAGSEFEKAAHNTSMHVFSDLQSLMDSIGENPIEDSLVLLKGSRGMEMERLLKVL